MSDVTTAAPESTAAAAAPVASTVVDSGAAPTVATPPAGISTINEHTPPVTGHEGDAGGARRKTAEEKVAELNQRFLKAHKTFAPPAERRKEALELLDGLRDRVRLETNRVQMPDGEVDAIIVGFVSAGIEATKVS